ncbi:MAG: MFS transporter [Bacilli bacterium]
MAVTSSGGSVSDRVSLSAKRAFAAAFGGYALDGFDFMIFTLVLSTIISVFGLSIGQAGLLATASLFVSAFGGLFAGVIADYWGRARALAIAILFYAVFTGLTGLAQNFSQLLVFRAFEGLGFGGAWAAGAALLSESAPAHLRGRWLGWMQSSWAIGWGAALIVELIIAQTMGLTAGWRVLFYIGALPALFVLYVLRRVEEPDVWRKTIEIKRQLREQELVKGTAKNKDLTLTFFQLWRGDLLPRTLLATLLSTGALFGYYSIFTLLPTFLIKVRHLSAIGSGPYLALVIIGSFVGYVTSGWLNDRLGRRMNFLFFAIGSAIIVLLYTAVVKTNTLLIPLSFPLGFFASGIFSGFGSYLAELFPTRVRGAAQGFTYNGGRAIAAFAPALIGYLSGALGGLGHAIAIFGPISYLLCIIAVLALPETKGVELKPMD